MLQFMYFAELEPRGIKDTTKDIEMLCVLVPQEWILMPGELEMLWFW